MRTFTIALLAGVGALAAASGAKAADIYTTSEYANPELVQEVRLVCDDAGNCYRTRGGSRVIVRDSYNAMPRDRYYERRTYPRLGRWSARRRRHSGARRQRGRRCRRRPLVTTAK